MRVTQLHQQVSLPKPLSGTVRCYTCGGMGIVTGPPGSDPVEDRSSWPALPCFFTAGCGGQVDPEALN